MRSLRTWLWLGILAGSLGIVARGADPPAPANATKPTPSRDDLERRLAEQLSGATLSGSFTLTDATGERPPAKDQYQLVKVSKVADDRWLFVAKIGEHDVTLPIPLEIRWAGDTPVVQLTDLPIPGIGTFSARVLFYGDQYAGTWSGKDHGGHIFGKIVRNEKAAEGSSPK